MFSVRFNKTIGLSVAFLLFEAIPVFAHDGRTPFSVLKDMKQKKTGPYASPFIMGDKTLVQDWLRIRTEDSSHTNSQPGVLIVEVKEGGLADEEGLEKGDLIIGVNDTPVRIQADLERFLEGIKEPEVFTFHLIRDNEEDEEDVYLDNNLGEMDQEMTDLIMSKSKKGGFEKGMLMEDMMARSPLGSMNGQEGVISPQAIMQQMMARTPMGKREAFPDNMKNVDLSRKEQSVSGFVRDPKTETVYRSIIRGTGNRIEGARSYSLFQKADYQITVDRKIRVMEHPANLKELALNPDQKKKTTNLNRTIKKYLIKRDALLAITRLDLEGALEKFSIDQATNTLKKYQQLQEEKYIRLIRFVVEFESFLEQNQKEIFRTLAQDSRS
jgi:hypothetical protein